MCRWIRIMHTSLCVCVGICRNDLNCCWVLSWHFQSFLIWVKHPLAMEARMIFFKVFFSPFQNYNEKMEAVCDYISHYLTQVVISTLIHRAQVMNYEFCCFSLPRSTLPTVQRIYIERKMLILATGQHAFKYNDFTSDEGKEQSDQRLGHTQCRYRY